MRELIKKFTPNSLIFIYQKLRYLWIVAFFYLCRVLPVQKKKVVLCNVWGYGDNAKYVTEELIRQNMPYELVFVTNHPSKAPSVPGVHFLKTNSLRAIKALATSGVWVENNRKEAFTRKRKHQYYIQLWHGGLPLKKIEGDCAEYLGKSYIKRAKHDSLITDLYVSNGKFCTNMYRRAFWFSGEIMECGTPRNDILISGNDILSETTKESFNIAKNKKIALYAPTYRGSDNNYSYVLDFEKIRKTIENKFSGEWVIVIRLHPLVAFQSEMLKYSEAVLNGSDYSDMYELMQASDILITDYSNTMFEFAMMHRPVFLYTKDIISYSAERGLYFKMENLPFPIANTEDHLMELIENYDNQEQLERSNIFFNQVALVETGNASFTVVKKINQVIKNSMDN